MPDSPHDVCLCKHARIVHLASAGRCTCGCPGFSVAMSAWDLDRLMELTLHGDVDVVYP